VPWPLHLHNVRACAGSYEVKNFGSIGVAAEKAASKPSAAFRPADYLDRFGRPLVRKGEEGTCVAEGPSRHGCWGGAF